MSIFISYSRNDEKTVEALVVGLEAARRDVWFDRDLGGGDAWWDKIIENICRCTVFVFAVSDDSLQSRPCRNEVDYARATGRPVLPVQVGPVTSFRGTPFADVQVVAFRPDVATAGFEIIAAVDQAAERVQPLPDPLPSPPPIPYAYLHAIGRQIDSVELDPGDQLKVVDQLRRALGEETDHAVRRDIFAMLDSLMRQPWSTRRTEKEIRATMFAWDTTSLVAMSPGLEQEMALAREQEQEQEQVTVHPAAGSADAPEPDDEADRVDAPATGSATPGSATPGPAAPRPRRTAALMGVVAGAGLVVGLLVGIAVAPQPQPAGGSAGPSGTGPGTQSSTPVLPASTALTDDQLVVSVKRDGVWQLDLATTRSTSPVRTLVERKTGSRFPVLSPDRRSMIYVAAAGGEDASLRVAAVDGKGDRALFAQVPDECSGEIRRPAWNPADPSVLAVPCQDSADRWSLRLVRTDGTVTGKVDVKGKQLSDPTWSSDGSMLAFWGTQSTSTVDGGALYVADGDGTNVVAVTDSGPGVDADPAWKPAEPTLAFRRRAASEADDICRVTLSSARVPGPVTCPVVNGARNTDPAWSPSGRSLAYVSNAPLPNEAAPTTAVRRVWVSQDGEPAKALWNAPDADEQNAPAWTRR